MPIINKKYSIGIDVGGTKICAVLLSGDKVIAENTLGTPTDTLDHFLVMVMAVIEPLLERAKRDKAKVADIGIGIPGTIDEKKETVLSCANLSLLNGTKLPVKFKNKFGLKIKMDNDARCFVRAEAMLGAGKECKNVYGITIGTGIGGGWFYNGKIYSGAGGGGSEPGHMVINNETGADWEDVYHDLTSGSGSIIAKKAKIGDQRSLRTFEEVGQVCGIAFANIINIIGPEMIVVGGGVSESLELFAYQAKETMEKYIINSSSKKTRIVKARLGQSAGAIGAALLK